MEYPVDESTIEGNANAVNESTMEDNANAVDRCNNAASPENVSSSDYAEETDDNGCSDTDSYIELYDNYDNKRKSCDYEQDTVNDAPLDDEDTFDVEDDSLEKEKRKEAVTKSSIAEWVIECNISRCHVSNLLRRLKLDCGLSFLPLDSRTLLKTMRNKPNVRVVPPGQYAHFGLVNVLLSLLSYHKVDNTVTKITIVFHVDGIPIAKSSGSQFWPILCSIYGYDKVIIIGIYHGFKKPEDVNLFILELVEEAKVVLKDGLKYGGRVLEVEIAALVCDAPARCLVTSVVSHNAYYGCHKCETKGVWIRSSVLSNYGGRVTYPNVNDRLRTNESFRTRSQSRHHKTGRSIIEELPFDIVKKVPVDYMHNVCIGAEKKLLRTWISGKMDGTRLTKEQVISVSNFLVYVKRYVPVEFPRKTRTLDDFPHLKATEHRNHLLYFLPVALQGVLHQDMYDNYMLLHVSIKILTNSHNSRTYASYAEILLKKFTKDCVLFYGRKFISYNIHNLIHLPSDVEEIGCLDSYSAFPFENKLQSIKNLIRTSANPLSQVIRRVKEIEEIATDVYAPVLSKEVVCSHLHSNGPILPDFIGVQFKNMKFQNWEIGIKRPNHCVFLKDGSVALIKNILKGMNGKVSILVKKYLIYDCLFVSPISSLDFQEIIVSQLHSDYQLHDVYFVACKAIRFPITNPKNGKYYVAPLLMS